MADYKDIINGTISTLVGKAKEFAASDTVTGLVEKVKNAAEESGVAKVYEDGASRTKAYARIAKLTLEVNGAHEELSRVYAEIGKLYYEQAKDAPEGYFTALFSQAGRLAADIRAKRDQMQELKDRYGAEGKMDDDMSAFDDIVSAAERDATQVPKG